MDSPLLSYIDVRHANFLPTSLIVGEAQDFGPRYTTAEDLAPVRDDLAEHVSQSHRARVPIGELEALVQIAEPVAVELVNSSEAESDPGEDEMVTRRTMTISPFMLGAWLAS